MLRHGAAICAVGVVLGLLIGTAFGRAMSGLLFGVEAFDPLTMILATTVAIAVVFGALFVPARRAASVDPLAMLREP